MTEVETMLSVSEARDLDLYTKEVRAVTDNELVPLSSEKEANTLAEWLARAATARKALDKSRKDATKPLRDQVKDVDGLYNPMIEVLKGFDSKGKRVLLAWRHVENARIERERRESEERAIEAAIREGEALRKAQESEGGEKKKAQAEADVAARDQMIETITAPTKQTRGVRTDTGTTSVKERWIFEVVNEELVPRQFLCVDRKAIRAAVAAGMRKISGVSIELEESLAVRTG